MEMIERGDHRVYDRMHDGGIDRQSMANAQQGRFVDVLLDCPFALRLCSMSRSSFVGLEWCS
jgi:hypothetical protein